MALVDRTSIGRYGATVIVAAVLTALAVAIPGPARGQDTGDPDGAPANPFPANTFHVFLLDNGEFTTIDPPGATGPLTTATGINDRGQIVGYYLDAGGIFHGFLRDKTGVFTAIEHPDAPLGTVALDINDRGQIVGAYVDAGGTDPVFLCGEEVSPRSMPQALTTTSPLASGRGQALLP